MAADLSALRAPRDRLLATPEFAASISAGGIFIGDGEPTGFAVVVAVGPGLLVDGERLALPVAVGDKIAYAKDAGVQVRVRGERLIVLREADVLAVAEE